MTYSALEVAIVLSIMGFPIRSVVERSEHESGEVRLSDSISIDIHEHDMCLVDVNRPNDGAGDIGLARMSIQDILQDIQKSSMYA